MSKTIHARVWPHNNGRKKLAGYTTTIELTDRGARITPVTFKARTKDEAMKLADAHIRRTKRRPGWKVAKVTRVTLSWGKRGLSVRTSGPRWDSKLKAEREAKPNGRVGFDHFGRAGRAGGVDAFVKANFKDTGRARKLLVGNETRRQHQAADEAHCKAARARAKRGEISPETASAICWEGAPLKGVRNTDAARDRDAATLRRSTKPMASLPKWWAEYGPTPSGRVYAETVMGANKAEATAMARVVGRSKYPRLPLVRVKRKMEY